VREGKKGEGEEGEGERKGQERVEIGERQGKG